jgi:hypothetical protein
MRLKSFKLFEMDFYSGEGSGKVPEKPTGQKLRPYMKSNLRPDEDDLPSEAYYSELGPDTYFKDDYLAFVGAVEAWMKETGKRVMWALTPFGYSKRDIDNEKASKVIWDSFVTDERDMTLIEMGDKLVAVLQEGDKIIMAVDNEDKAVDFNQVKDKI